MSIVRKPVNVECCRTKETMSPWEVIIRAGKRLEVKACIALCGRGTGVHSAVRAEPDFAVSKLIRVSVFCRIMLGSIREQTGLGLRRRWLLSLR